MTRTTTVTLFLIVALTAQASVMALGHARPGTAGATSVNLPTKTVSEAESVQKMAQLKARGHGPISTNRRGRVICHVLSREDFYIVTGIDSEYGGMLCHWH